MADVSAGLPVTEQETIDRLVDAVDAGDLPLKLAYGRALLAGQARHGWDSGELLSIGPFVPFERIEVAATEDDLDALLLDEVVTERRYRRLAAGAALSHEEQESVRSRRASVLLQQECATTWWTILKVRHSRGRTAFLAMTASGAGWEVFDGFSCPCPLRIASLSLQKTTFAGWDFVQAYSHYEDAKGAHKQRGLTDLRDLERHPDRDLD
jgi:hypothetical protein